MIAQTVPGVLKGDYLGEPPPGLTARLFAKGTISSDSLEHSAPAFSPDGNTVVWTVIYNRGHAFLLEMRRKNNTWTRPANPSFADTSADDFYPSFSKDGKTLYFSSRREVPDGYTKGQGIRIWSVQRKGDEWGTATPIDTTVSKGDDYAHSITSDGTFYFSVRRQGGREFDIVYSRKRGGKYQKPEKLPYNINTTKYEDGPFIAPDESYLIFESDRLQGIDGSIDLYITFRNSNGQWTTPKNMGSKLNSGFAERFARVSPDGKYLFFGSTRTGIFDIYWIAAAIIDELKKEVQKENENLINDSLGKKLLTALYTNENEKAAENLKQWITIYPNDPEATVEYSSVLRRDKKYPDAESALRKMLQASPGNINLKMEMALVKYGLNSKTEAEEIVSSIINSRPDPGSIYLNLASSLVSMSRFREAADYYEKAIQIRPREPDYYNLACCYALLNEKEKAFENLDKALRNGYGSKQLLQNDSDLNSIRTDPRFTEFLNRVK